MKVTEKKPHSVHLRLTDEQYEFLRADAELFGIGIADYIRMIINTTMYTTRTMASAVQSKLGDLKNEHDTNTVQYKL